MNTSNPRPSPFAAPTLDALAGVKAALEALGPPPPKVEFVASPFLGKGWVTALVNGHPVGALSPEKFEELKAKLPKEPRP